METLIRKLSDMRGVSGHEYRISDQIADLFRQYADEVSIDALGNIIAVKKAAKKHAKKIMIEAHMDEIGLMVKEIDKRGFLTFVNIGGVDNRILPALEVTVHGVRDLKGVIGAKPPHLQEPGEAKKSTKISDMAIDVGMDYDEVSKLVSVGDTVSLPQSVGKMGTQLSGKSMDDRASVAALLTVLENLKRVNLDVDVYAVAAVQEEVGCRGAKVAAYGIEPDLAVAVDVCHGITPDNSHNAFETGTGTVISIGPNIHPKIHKRLIDTAEKYHVAYHVDADGGETGTDAWTIQITRAGVPTALLSIPLKYMHTAVETLSVSDVEATASLLTYFIQNLEGELEEWLCY